MDPQFQFKAKIWLWTGKGAWHFITVPLDLSKTIKGFALELKGFRSVPVEVKIGQSTWKTSLFPEKKGTYLLPLKKAIRQAESLEIDDEVDVTITLR